MTEIATKSPPCFIRFEPAYETEPYGGQRIIKELGRSRLLLEAASASIEFSTDADRALPVTEGSVSGCTWSELTSHFGEDLTGARGRALMESGLALEVCFKATDLADSPLSMIKPGAGASRKQGPRPMGAAVIMEAEPEAVLYYGRRRSLGEDRFLACLRKGHGTEILQEHKPGPGGVLLIPPGLPYALGQGMLAYLATVEQAPAGKKDERRASAKTRGAQKGVVATPVPPSRVFVKSRGWLAGMNAVTWLYAGDSFCTVRLELRSEWKEEWQGPGPRQSFLVLTGVQGRALLLGGSETEVIERGRTVVVSASCQSYRINPGAEGASILKTWLMDPVAEIERPLIEHGLTQREIEGLYGFFGKGTQA